MGDLILASERMLFPSRGLLPGWVRIRGGRVVQMATGTLPPRTRRIDLGRDVCAPGFIDLHVHGGGGAQINGRTPADACDGTLRTARFHVRHGTTSLLATTVSDDPTGTLASVRGVVAAMAQPSSARVLGIHLEGPWLAPTRSGAQNPEVLRPVDQGELYRVLAAAEQRLRIVTLAPELPGADALIEQLVSANVIPSLGHTAADAAQTLNAISLGARHMTHLFNAMPGIASRRPGPIAAALTRPDVSVELIADGHHVDPIVLALAFRAASQPVLITDSTAAAGLGPGSHRLGVLDIEVDESARVTLRDQPDTLAGSALTMDAAVRVVVAAGVPLERALRAATRTPAAVLRRDDIGVIRPGARADLVVLDEGLHVAMTLVDGRPAHDPQARFDG